jgi:hypothetical protein
MSRNERKEDQAGEGERERKDDDRKKFEQRNDVEIFVFLRKNLKKRKKKEE